MALAAATGGDAEVFQPLQIGGFAFLIGQFADLETASAGTLKADGEPIAHVRRTTRALLHAGFVGRAALGFDLPLVVLGLVPLAHTQFLDHVLGQVADLRGFHRVTDGVPEFGDEVDVVFIAAFKAALAGLGIADEHIERDRPVGGATAEFHGVGLGGPDAGEGGAERTASGGIVEHIFRGNAQRVAIRADAVGDLVLGGFAGGDADGDHPAVGSREDGFAGDVLAEFDVTADAAVAAIRGIQPVDADDGRALPDHFGLGFELADKVAGEDAAQQFARAHGADALGMIFHRVHAPRCEGFGDLLFVREIFEPGLRKIEVRRIRANEIDAAALHEFGVPNAGLAGLHVAGPA